MPVGLLHGDAAVQKVERVAVTWNSVELDVHIVENPIVVQGFVGGGDTAHTVGRVFDDKDGRRKGLRPHLRLTEMVAMQRVLHLSTTQFHGYGGRVGRPFVHAAQRKLGVDLDTVDLINLMR